jgi:hypothetical protein
LQSTIIQELGRRKKWRWSTDIVWDVFNALYRANHDGDDPDWRDQPSKAFGVAVRRGAAGLVRRGLIVAGMPEYSQEGFKVALWLPEHEAPTLKRTIPQALVENSILLALSKITESQAEESFEFGKMAIRRMALHRQPGDVSYEHLVAAVLKTLPISRRDVSRLRVSIHRAAYRLQSKGRVRLTWHAPRRIGAVRLLP